ncbi:porin [Herbaspirillum sp. alder98]|uniref:porin n=1 Tax=Herbaspirillum sp. alder98 TaxID=2913096 RepID=UPI001CD8E6B2|nr:porin [Herbaspirillum sp. alder98]MCA1326850.1 porin [Herbaspirillum sp. alder98]
MAAVSAGLALGTVCATATAQSSVIIYGIIDTGVEYVNHTNAAGQGKLRTLPLTGLSPSRIGFRGTEDLGGGLRAFFNLESGFVPTTGGMGQGNRLFGRQSNVGLSDPLYGTITLGRQYNMTAISMIAADVMGPANHGLSNMDSYLPNTRSDNALGYMNKLGNTTVGATYSFGRDTSTAGGPAATSCAGENAGDAQACRQWTALLKYDTTSWGVATAYDTLRGGAGAGNLLTSSNYKDNRASFNGWFKIGDLKIGGGLIARHQQRAVSINSNLYYVGASYQWTPVWLLEGQLVHMDVKDSGDDSTLGTARLIYALSKRTNLYASYAYIKNRGNAAIAVSSGNTVGVGQNQASVMAGIRHTF